jgi:hypothetical protein
MYKAFAHTSFLTSTLRIAPLPQVSSRVVSALIHIGSELEEAWPLEIEDHNGALHAINLQPGQVSHQSAALYHSFHRAACTWFHLSLIFF